MKRPGILARRRYRRVWNRLERKGFLVAYPKFYISGVEGHAYAFHASRNKARFWKDYTPKQARILKQGIRLAERFGFPL